MRQTISPQESNNNRPLPIPAENNNRPLSIPAGSQDEIVLYENMEWGRGQAKEHKKKYIIQYKENLCNQQNITGPFRFFFFKTICVI